MPHLLFTVRDWRMCVYGTRTTPPSDACLSVQGPPGCGKTATAWCLARALLRGADTKATLLSVNASEVRSARALEARFDEFERVGVRAVLPPRRHRIMLFDEADRCAAARARVRPRARACEARAAQHAPKRARRAASVHGCASRCAAARNLQRVVGATRVDPGSGARAARLRAESHPHALPPQSQCIILRFEALTADGMQRRLAQICAAESVRQAGVSAARVLCAPARVGLN